MMTVHTLWIGQSYPTNALAGDKNANAAAPWQSSDSAVRHPKAPLPAAIASCLSVSSCKRDPAVEDLPSNGAIIAEVAPVNGMLEVTSTFS